jgi:hypothetical protein
LPATRSDVAIENEELVTEVPVVEATINAAKHRVVRPFRAVSGIFPECLGVCQLFTQSRFGAE